MADTMKTWVDSFYELNPDAIQEVSTKKKKASAVPLADELTGMDTKDHTFYTSLSPAQQKEVSLWVLMRFMSSSSQLAEHHLLMVNDIVNNHFSTISKHPELQWRLLTMCGTGRKQYHQWIAPPKGIKKNRLEEALLAHYPLLNTTELALMIKISSKEDVINFFANNGCTDKEIAEILKGSEFDE